MLPKIGDQLMVRFCSGEADAGEQEEEVYYKSRLADENDKMLAFEMPILPGTGKAMKLYAGDRLTVQYFSEGGIQVFFETEVLGIQTERVDLVWVKRPAPESLTRIQRRNYLRVPAELEIAVKTDSHQFTAVTEDLSGGGLAFPYTGTYVFLQGQILSCWLLIQWKKGEVEHIPFKASVVRSIEKDNGTKRVMVQFTDIQETDRQKIIRFCLDRQLELRKKEQE